MSKSWKHMGDTFLKLLISLVSWKLAQLISQNKTRINKKFLDSKLGLKVYFKNRDARFLPLPSKPDWKMTKNNANTIVNPNQYIYIYTLDGCLICICAALQIYIVQSTVQAQSNICNSTLNTLTLNFFRLTIGIV